MKVFFLGIHLVTRLIGFIIKLMALLKKYMMWSLMKLKAHMKKKDNLDDVRSDGLRNVMKNMSISDIRPREEDEEEIDSSIPIRVIPSTSTPSTNDQAQPIDQATHDDNSQAQDQPGSSTSPSTSTQEPVAPPRVHHAIAKDHPMDQIMGDIIKGVPT